MHICVCSCKEGVSSKGKRCSPLHVDKNGRCVLRAQLLSTKSNSHVQNSNLIDLWNAKLNSLKSNPISTTKTTIMFINKKEEEDNGNKTFRMNLQEEDQKRRIIQWTILPLAPSMYTLNNVNSRKTARFVNRLWTQWSLTSFQKRKSSHHFSFPMSAKYKRLKKGVTQTKNQKGS